MLTAEAFESLAIRFARRKKWTLSRAPPDDFVQPKPPHLDSGRIPLRRPPPQPLSLQPPPPPPPAAAAAAAAAAKARAVMPSAELDDDPLALPPAPPPLDQHLQLHIVFSLTYAAPQLLVHGYHPDGTPWTLDQVRCYLEECMCASSTGVPTSMITQVRTAARAFFAPARSHTHARRRPRRWSTRHLARPPAPFMPALLRS